MPEKMLLSANRVKAIQAHGLRRASAKSLLLSLCVGSLFAAATEEDKSIAPSSGTVIRPTSAVIDGSQSPGLLKPISTQSRGGAASGSLATKPRMAPSASGISSKEMSRLSLTGWVDPGVNLRFAKSKDSDKTSDGYHLSPEFQFFCPFAQSAPGYGFLQLESIKNPGFAGQSSHGFFAPEVQLTGGGRFTTLIPGSVLGLSMGGGYSFVRESTSGKMALEWGKKSFVASLLGGYGFGKSSANAKTAPYVALSGRGHLPFSSNLKMYLTLGGFFGDKIKGLNTAHRDATVSSPFFVQWGGMYQIIKFVRAGLFIRNENIFNQSVTGADQLSWSDFWNMGLHLQIGTNSAGVKSGMQGVKTLATSPLDIWENDPFVANIGPGALSYVDYEESIPNPGSKYATLDSHVARIGEKDQLTLHPDALKEAKYTENDSIYLGISESVKIEVLRDSVPLSPNTADGLQIYTLGTLKEVEQFIESKKKIEISFIDFKNGSEDKIISSSVFYLGKKEVQGGKEGIQDKFERIGYVNVYPKEGSQPEASWFTSTAQSSLPEGISLESGTLGAFCVKIKPTEDGNLPGKDKCEVLSIEFDPKDPNLLLNNCTIKWTLQTVDNENFIVASIMEKTAGSLDDVAKKDLKDITANFIIGNDNILAEELPWIDLAITSLNITIDEEDSLGKFIMITNSEVKFSEDVLIPLSIPCVLKVKKNTPQNKQVKKVDEEEVKCPVSLSQVTAADLKKGTMTVTGIFPISKESFSFEIKLPIKEDDKKQKYLYALVFENVKNSNGEYGHLPSELPNLLGPEWEKFLAESFIPNGLASPTFDLLTVEEAKKFRQLVLDKDKLKLFGEAVTDWFVAYPGELPIYVKDEIIPLERLDLCNNLAEAIALTNITSLNEAPRLLVKVKLLLNSSSAV